MLRALKKHLPEITIYLIVWGFIFAELAFMSTGESVVISPNFQRDLLKALPVLLLFIINTVWLIPTLLFEKRTWLYIVAVIALSGLFVMAGEIAFPFRKVSPLDSNFERPRGEPMKFDSFNRDTFIPGQTPPPIPGNRVQPDYRFRPNRPPMNFLGIGFLNRLVICLLILSLNTAIKVTFKWFRDEQTRKEIEKDYLKAELAMLQNQISPHFFMNTLNNIHGLVEMDAKLAKQSILQLSKMMRYLLYESDQGVTTLQREIEFLRNYVDLMRLRIDETIPIELNVPKAYQNMMLPPLLLMPFVENAFKHGISYREKSYVRIKLEQVGHFLTFYCSNRKVAPTRKGKASGIGQKNAIKRLDLLFGKSYSLSINDSGEEYNVKLILPLNGN